MGGECRLSMDGRRRVERDVYDTQQGHTMREPISSIEEEIEGYMRT
jgi:hypothetical protein